MMAVCLETSLEPKFTKLRGEPIGAGGQPWVDTYSEWRKNFALEHGRNPHGDPLPLEYFPKQVRLVKGDRLFDVNNYLGGGIVYSQRFKDAAEDIEPGVHQFVPVEVLRKDGSPYGEPFYYFTICTSIDAINPELGGIEKQEGYDFANHPDRYSYHIALGGRDKLAVYKEKIAGRAAWRDCRYIAHEFFSDAFMERVKAEGMEGWEISTYWHEL